MSAYLIVIIFLVAIIIVSVAIWLFLFDDVSSPSKNASSQSDLISPTTGKFIRPTLTEPYFYPHSFF